MDKAYLIERMQTDSMENHIERALYWTPVGIALNEVDARKAVEADGTHPGSVWPHVEAGTPKRRMTELPIL